MTESSKSGSITFIGHATFLIHLGGMVIMTDPYYGSFLGGIMPRLTPPPITLDQLPEISLIVVTHSHFDHLSVSTIKGIKSECPILLPQGAGRYLEKRVSKKVIELSRDQTVSMGEVVITAFPCEHQSSRYWLGKDTGTCSYLLRWNDTSVFFVGDAGFSPLFREVGKLHAVDIAILPIGMATPALLFGKNHLSPARAIQAFLNLNATVLVPSHFGTFRTILEDHRRPLRELEELADRKGIREHLRILEAGAPWEMTSSRAITPPRGKIMH